MKRSVVFQCRKQPELLLALVLPISSLAGLLLWSETGWHIVPAPTHRAILRWEMATSSGFHSVCILSVVTAALQSTRSRAHCLCAAPACRASPAEQGVGRWGRFQCLRDLSAQGFRAAPLLERHDSSGFLVYCKHSSCTVAFASLKRCWGALPAGLCAGRRRCACGVRMLQQMFHFLPLVLAHWHFFPQFSLLHLPKSVPGLVPLSFQSQQQRKGWDGAGAAAEKPGFP